jgi:hypothetical protein
VNRVGTRARRPVHDRRGSAGPYVLAHRLRCTRSGRRPRNNGDQQDRLRRCELLRLDRCTNSRAPDYGHPAISLRQHRHWRRARLDALWSASAGLGRCPHRTSCKRFTAGL